MSPKVSDGAAGAWVLFPGLEKTWEERDWGCGLGEAFSNLQFSATTLAAGLRPPM